MFLINRESRSLIRAGKSWLHLSQPVGECFTNSLEVPEGALAYPEPLMLEFVAERGFTVREKYLGEWCGRPEKQFIQDVLILEKRLPRKFWFLQKKAG